ncbi:MAG: type 4a pilus biogenesis protein PilO [Gammaproteobacteria bacterium]|nr:type 4a pilus biogenesis protein PilO [Gammaproteobacteria bacterium]
MTFDDLNDLSLSNIGIWPAPVKAIFTLLLCILLGVGWYYLDTEDQLIALEKVEKKELQLRKEFENKQRKAASLEDYKKQLKEMRQSFNAMLQQLPNKAEVADLLVDVSQTGLAAGLEFELFDPSGEVAKEFYAELPINIKVLGGYHEFGEFISGLAALPRIVTIHNVHIYPQEEKNRGKGSEPAPPSGKLVLQAVAKTYRYLDEEAEK